MTEIELYGKMVNSVYDYLDAVEVEESIADELKLLMAKLAGFDFEFPLGKEE